jgi:type II secretory pathway pseudopilin PulG
MGIGLALIGDVWSTTVKRERERELLFVGAQFRQAIGRYYDGSPGVKQYPRKLEDLLEDKRFPVIKRYLRKIYIDPMTGKTNWGSDPGRPDPRRLQPIQDKPLKIANFRSRRAFADSNAYSDWRFVYAPLSGQPGQAAGRLTRNCPTLRPNPNAEGRCPCSRVRLPGRRR